MSGAIARDARDLQELLLARAEPLRAYLERKIPERFRSILSAEDVLQEVWITAFRTISSDIRDMDRWLTTLANTKLIDALRAIRTLKRGGDRRFVRDAAQRLSSFEGLFGRLCAQQKTPSREVSAQEARHAVQVALSALPDDRRQVIRLRHIEGLSRKEIAGIMQKTEAAINSLLYRGLNELRGRVGDAAKFFSDIKPAGSTR